MRVRRAAGRGYSYFHLYMCVFVSQALTKRKTTQTWNLVPTLHKTKSENDFFFFSKKWPRRPLASRKTAASSEFSEYFLDCLVSILVLIFVYLKFGAHNSQARPNLKMISFLFLRKNDLAGLENQPTTHTHTREHAWKLFACISAYFFD